MRVLLPGFLLVTLSLLLCLLLIYGVYLEAGFFTALFCFLFIVHVASDFEITLPDGDK